jgi:anti-sigma factor RsiW
MAENPPIDSDSLHEELTAYLDGELDAESVRRVEERLARDSTYQAELQRLERAWGLLDRLPRATVNDSFTQTTIEMVAVAASREADAVRTGLPGRRRRQQLVGLAGVLAALAIGFGIGHSMWPNPNQQLLQDLEVLQNFERYYQVDSIDFLRMLEDQNLFAEGDSDHAG